MVFSHKSVPKDWRASFGDVNAGAVVAILSLPMTIPLGVMALAPLGPDYAQAGVVAGFNASIVAGAIAAAFGGSRLQVSGPRGSVSLTVAAAVTTALADPRLASFGMPVGEAAIFVAFAVTLMAGTVQMAMGLLKIGSCTKYFPYPVLSGFINAVALLIFSSQIAAACGLPASTAFGQVLERTSEIKPAAIAVTLLTMALMWQGRRLLPKVPPIILAFAAGTAFHHLLGLGLPAEDVGPLVGAIPASLPDLSMVGTAFQMHWSPEVLGLLAHLLPSVIVLALLCSTESLLSAVAVDSVAGGRCDGNRELTGQGLSNIASACFGGIASTGAPVRGIASFHAGGRSRWAGIFHSLFLLAALMWGGALLAAIPYSVMAGIMLMISISMADIRTLLLVRQAGKRFAADLIIVLLVVGASIMVTLPAAVILGLGIACVQFVARMSQPIVRRVADRSACRSLRIRPLHVEAYLMRNAHRLIVAELEGPLFFGTSEQLRDELDRLTQAPQPPSVIILDFRRVNHIDLSGLRILAQAARSLADRDIQVFLSSIPQNSRIAPLLHGSGIEEAISSRHWFATLEIAVEKAEDLLIEGDTSEGAEEIRLAALGLTERMTDEELQALAMLLERRAYPADSYVFRYGTKGDGMFLMVKGLVEIALPSEVGPASVRLALFGPGTFFGEMALLDNGPRSANAIALTETVVWHLSNERFEWFRVNHPTAATRLLLNLGRELSHRIRVTNSQLQYLE